MAGTVRDRKPLIVFAPLPPQRNGIADYVAELAPYLGERYDCTYVIADDAPDPAPLVHASIICLSDYSRAEELRGAPHLYHVGNNPDHGFLLSTAMTEPGILVLHDVTLHYLFERATVGRGDRDGYQDQLVRDVGLVGRLLGQQVAVRGWSGELTYFAVRLNQQLIARSKAVITHSRYAALMARAVRGAPPVFRVPHLFLPSPEPDIAARQAARRKLGILDDVLLLLSLGFVTRAKQIELFLRVLDRIRNRLPEFHYFIAGEPDAYSDVYSEILALGLSTAVTVTGYLPDEMFPTYLAAADIVVNLRHPTGGETSGTLIRALGGGACVAVTDLGAFAEFPDECIVKVPWGSNVMADLEAAILRLAAGPELRHRYGSAARQHILSHHAPSSSAKLYEGAIEHAAARPTGAWAVEGAFEYPSRAAVVPAEPLEEPGWMWRRERMLPFGLEGRTLGLRSRLEGLDALVSREFGYRVVALDLDGEEHADRTLDVVLFSGSVGALSMPAQVWLRAANRVLRFGGVLILDSWSDGLGTEIPWQPGADELLAAGFSLVASSTGVPPRWLGQHPGSGASSPEQVWSETCVRCVKVTEFTPVLVQLPELPRLPSSTSPAA